VVDHYAVRSVDGAEEICHWPKDRQSQKAPLVIIAQNFNFVTDRLLIVNYVNSKLLLKPKEDLKYAAGAITV